MAIQRSSAPQTAALIHDLSSPDAVRREAAIARLAIAGARAVAPLLRELTQASPAGQIAILRTLERMEEPRALPAAIGALGSAGEPVVLAAIGAVRPHLRSADHRAATTALDALAAVAVDTVRPEAVRVAAIDALTDLGADVLTPLRERLRDEPRARVRRAAGIEGPVATDMEAAAAQIESAAQAPGDDPDALRRLLLEAGASVGLSTLHELVLVLRKQERSAPDAVSKAGWEAARSAAHGALAERGSRLALFDLRESLDEAAPPRLDEFASAVARIGDAACLEPLARAWLRTTAAGSRGNLEHAARLTVERERLTGRHAVVKRLHALAPDLASRLLPARRSR